MENNDFVGIPWVKGESGFDGADCWGLVLLYYRTVFGKKIKEYDKYIPEGPERKRVIDTEKQSTGWKKLARPQEGAVCVMALLSENNFSHVGVCLNSKDVLHSLSGCSIITKIEVLKRKFLALEFYECLL